MTVGALMEALTQYEDSDEVAYDFVYMRPTTLDSYRGYYEDLALGYTSEGSITVRELKELLSSSMGKTFHGYKGGEYTMNENTLLWVANYREAGGTAITGVTKISYQVILMTSRLD